MTNKNDAEKYDAVYHKPKTDWKPGDPVGQSLPPIPDGTYPATLAAIRNVPKPQWMIDWEAQRDNKPIRDIPPRQYEWIFFIKDPRKFEVQNQETQTKQEYPLYDRELAMWTRVSLHPASNTYKIVTMFLGRELQEGEGMALIRHLVEGQRCLVSVGHYTSNRTGRVRNSINQVMLPMYGADWPTEPPEGWSYEKILPPEQDADSSAISSAEPDMETKTLNELIERGDVRPASMTKPNMSSAQQEFRSIIKSKGLSPERAIEEYRAFVHSVGWATTSEDGAEIVSVPHINDLQPQEQREVLEYFERNFNTEGDDDEDVPF